MQTLALVGLLLAVGSLPGAHSCAKYYTGMHFKINMEKYLFEEYMKKHPTCYNEYRDLTRGVKWAGSVVAQTTSKFGKEPAILQWWCAKYCNEECRSWPGDTIVLQDASSGRKERFDDIAYTCSCHPERHCVERGTLREIVDQFRSECMHEQDPMPIPKDIGFVEATDLQIGLHEVRMAQSSITEQLLELNNYTCCCDKQGGAGADGAQEDSCVADMYAVDAGVSMLDAVERPPTYELVDEGEGWSKMRVRWNLLPTKASVVAVAFLVESKNVDDTDFDYTTALFSPSLSEFDLTYPDDGTQETRIVVVQIPDTIVYAGNDLRVKSAPKVAGEETAYDIAWTPIRIGRYSMINLNMINMPTDHGLYVHSRNGSCAFAGNKDSEAPIEPVDDPNTGDMSLALGNFPDDPEGVYADIPQFSVMARHAFSRYDDKCGDCASRRQQCHMDFGGGSAAVTFSCEDRQEPPPPPVDDDAESSIGVRVVGDM